MLFLTNKAALLITLIHLIHIGRGIMGIIVLNEVPKLHEVIQQTPLEDKIMRMSDISTIFMNHVKSESLKYLEENKPRLTGYGIYTIICLLVDLCLLLAAFWSLFTADQVI